MRPSHSLKSPLHRLSLMVERLRSSPSCVGRACSSPLWSSYYVPHVASVYDVRAVQVALPHVASPPALLLTDLSNGSISRPPSHGSISLTFSFPTIRTPRRVTTLTSPVGFYRAHFSLL
nr:hypothetical protein Q903MT_gene2399 [Picea sitchensis]QHR89444.1 hypothetical protein Q903MT_gene3465 [Picea sitchensis]